MEPGDKLASDFYRRLLVIGYLTSLRRVITTVADTSYENRHKRQSTHKRRLADQGRTSDCLRSRSARCLRIPERWRNRNKRILLTSRKLTVSAALTRPIFLRWSIRS